MAYELKDYVEVADRIRAFHDANEDGRIVTKIIERPEDGASRWVVRASVYRDRLERKPCGVGHSFMAVPGSTPYTRGSELENAETSAVGRALVMAGIPAKNVASTDEVRGKRVDGPTATAQEGSPPSSAAPNRDKDRGPSATSAGAAGTGEGSAAPAVDLDGLELMQLAVKAHGNSLKALMAHVKAAHTEWEIRSVSDLTEGQMAVLVDCEHAA